MWPHTNICRFLCPYCSKVKQAVMSNKCNSSAVPRCSPSMSCCMLIRRPLFSVTLKQRLCLVISMRAGSKLSVGAAGCSGLLKLGDEQSLCCVYRRPVMSLGPNVLCHWRMGTDPSSVCLSRAILFGGA